MSTAPASTSASTVTVASKLPFSLRLQLQKKLSRTEDAFGGGVREVVSRIKDGRTLVIEGCSRPVGVDSEKQLVGGFALTHNVDAEFWNTWLAENGEFPPVEKGLIFATPKAGGTESEARDRRSLISGFEPVNPDAVPAEFAGVTKDS
jgi:hypothetical protein